MSAADPHVDTAAVGLKVLVVGKGAREHALAWAAGRSPRVGQVYVAPGNGGTDPTHRVDVQPTDVEALVRWCLANQPDLVIIGPEDAAEAGLADALSAAGIAVFGPTRAAARLEWSKPFARDFCARHGIDGPAYATFDADNVEGAIRWAHDFVRPVVVKAAGLAAGKGVVVPESWVETEAAIRRLLAAPRSQIVLEERLEGEEISLLAFCDGTTARAMPPAQDHKRIGEGERGPNTGGMGAYAPAPACPPELVADITTKVLQRTLTAMAAEGTPFVGVLYAGLMLTAAGPKVIEFNCRFGDPETQVLLPLLETDLVDVALACVEHRLDTIDVRFREGQSACTVVLASPGYPDQPTTGQFVTGDLTPDDASMVFHAATERGDDGALRTSGGRVLAVTGVGSDLRSARTRAYDRVAGIRFDGCQMRRDIGWRALARQTGGYAASGVDIDAGNDAVEQLKAHVARTQGGRDPVLAGVGAFGGALDVSRLRSFEHPVLVASTDGVGTKVMLAAQCQRYEGIGADIVNHCVNDVLVQGAEPLFFLDYIAMSRLVPDHVARVVAGMADACAANDCVLLGGETAEMPGVYVEGHFDIAGTLVGVVERDALLPRPTVRAGDVLIGLGSSGPHTNGYSLLRRVFEGMPLDASPYPLPSDVSLADALLAPHRSYLRTVLPALAARAESGDGTPLVKALVHITGGGLIENVPRALPDGLAARVRLGSWPVPPLFRLVRDASGLDAVELHRTLNMGIGMVLIAAREHAEHLRTLIADDSWIIGEVTSEVTGEVVGAHGRASNDRVQLV